MATGVRSPGALLLALGLAGGASGPAPARAQAASPPAGFPAAIATPRALLDPFPRQLALGEEAVLSGQLAAGLGHPTVFVTLPSGWVREEPVSSRGSRFEARIAFPAPGRYALEVLADGAYGPEVAAELTAVAGTAPPAPERRPDDGIEPDDPAEAEASVVRALNALRRDHDLAPLAAAPELAAVARAHAEAMRAAGRVAHLLPASGHVGARLTAAGIPYRAAYENVARAETSLAAHRAAEESPAHRWAMLQPRPSRVGVGIARERLPSGERLVYLAEVLVEPPDLGASSRLTPETQVREALWRERERLGAPPLDLDPALDGLAHQAAARFLARDEIDLGDLARRAVALGPWRRVAAAQAFVTTSLGEVARSEHLSDPRYHRAGVGVAIGDSRRYGPGRAFVVVLYSD
ncbi:MAG TPA: CAP domain-containing protein [Anaeromyxobacter sp.]|nr:CAP domain-containing protein [Anaeromyxobacter sp.]